MHYKIYSNSEILVVHILPQFLCHPIQQIQCTLHVQLVAEKEHKINIPFSFNSGDIDVISLNLKCSQMMYKFILWFAHFEHNIAVFFPRFNEVTDVILQNSW